MKTLNDYLNNGYSLNGGMTYQRGYVSQSVDIGGQIVHTAKGSRNGELYILEPCPSSTRYCFRHYITKR